MESEVLFLDGITLGQRVRVARFLAGWRQVDLAETAGVTQNDVSQLERDVPVYSAARRRILEALGLADPFEAPHG